VAVYIFMAWREKRKLILCYYLLVKVVKDFFKYLPKN